MLLNPGRLLKYIFSLLPNLVLYSILKGTVQRKLRAVLSGIDRKHIIWAWAAWG
jgi:hypothetical protein